jgi:hypothetical protein
MAKRSSLAKPNAAETSRNPEAPTESQSQLHQEPVQEGISEEAANETTKQMAEL